VSPISVTDLSAGPLTAEISPCQSGRECQSGLIAHLVEKKGHRGDEGWASIRIVLHALELSAKTGLTLSLERAPDQISAAPRCESRLVTHPKAEAKNHSDL